MKYYNSLIDLIGNTPIVKINKTNEGQANIFAKMEMFNPLCSIKDRAAQSMIDDAEKRGLLKPGGTLVEPTSGNTGIGFAFIAAIRGYKAVIVMPENCSTERKKLLKILGAELVLTPAEGGTCESIEVAKKIAKERNAFIACQFENPANVVEHREITAREIWDDMDGKVDIFIAGIGTGGTITGVGEALKEKNKDIKIVAMEPKNSSLLFGCCCCHKPHKIQGVGIGKIPEILNKDIIDEAVSVTDEDAIDMCRKLARNEAILGGLSSGAVMWVANELSKRPENKGKNIIALFADSAERYVSTCLFED
ncbi:cysteine synthase A [Parelusimicrobium proximum]|uniref:cysteine synthase A n=1 Tax=Parelusimicrobium proximum TaxID=3228953 RepID=UPI003D181586